jgi:hypothetical protein
MSLQHDYQDFVANLGLFCDANGTFGRGGKCSGWILSDFDTWHRCPCGAGAAVQHGMLVSGGLHPEDDYADYTRFAPVTESGWGTVAPTLTTDDGMPF